MASGAKRFKLYSDDELTKKQEDLQNVNTLKNEQKAERIFKAFGFWLNVVWKTLTFMGIEKLNWITV